jgi:hypothetical protein
MATQEPLVDSEFCPVCRTLPLGILTFGVEGPRMEYQLDRLQLDIETENKTGFGKCALYYLCSSMKRIWEGKEEFPALIGWDGPEYTCGPDKKSRLRVRTDQNTSICEKQFLFLEFPLISSVHYTDMSTAKLQRSKRWLPVHSDPQHPCVTARLREWIRTCDEKHEGCRVETIPILPTRVLDLEAGTFSSLIKLIETTKGQQGQYIALSHCWGTSHPFTTTRNNLQEMKKGFQLTEIPATFQDAITVSRQLGIRYLWIDSLCIIQGDTVDWEIESSRMGTVYRSASLVLSASNSVADSEGFLKVRPHTHSTLTITSTSTNQKAEIYLTPQKGEPADFWFYWDFNQTHTTQPLDTRGWCLQEAYLARRQLKFLHNRILWACQDIQQDEGEEDTIFSMPGTGAVFTTQNLFRNHVPRRHRVLNLMTPYQGWYRMVTDYARRKLTFAEDKMSALSGLASVVAENDGGEYLAGVWWEDVAFGICWKRVGGLERTGSYVAPSWSWASVNGPVEFIDAHEDYLTQTKVSLIEVVVFDSFHVANKGSDKFGRIENAWIKVKASMISLERSENGTFQIRGVESSEEKFDLSLDFTDDTDGNLAVLLLLRRLDNSPETSLIHQGYEEGALGVILFGLIVRAVPVLQKESEGLEVDDQGYLYERVGVVSFLTSESRESEFWGTNVTSVVLV